MEEPEENKEKEGGKREEERKMVIPILSSTRTVFMLSLSSEFFSVNGD